MAKKFKVKTKDGFIDKIVLFFGKLFKKAPKIVDLNDGETDKKSIMIGSHNGAGGPFNFRTFLDKRFMTWGAHPMCEGFNSRRKYLYYVFYRQKLGYGKLRSFLLSISFGLISKLFYNFAGIIPTYFDSRVFLTYKYSIECLSQDISVFIFPEDSSKGYKERVERFWPGFIYMSKLYYKKHGVDLPVYTLFYKRKPKTIIVGKPMHINQLLSERTEDEVMDIFRNYLNSLNDLDFDNIAQDNEFYIKTEPLKKEEKISVDEDKKI